MTTWIKDDRGNQCSVEYWGSEKEAKNALASNKNCSGCSDCSRCSGLENAAPAAGVANKPPSVPVIKNIHSVVYAAASHPKSLEMGNWHTCEKTHCRGGWVVTLAGTEGKALERFYNTELAAMLIYDPSAPGYKINPARFYDDNEAALVDMKKLAGV